MAGNQIRIRLKGYDHRVLDRSSQEIVETVKHTGSRVAGPIPLPTRRERFTMTRSPHVDKKSQETFENEPTNASSIFSPPRPTPSMN